MKSFGSFRLDTENHCLWREDERVLIPPKTYDVLRYLVENAGRLVTQDELLEALWSETYVNPEGLRKYILEIRKILRDQPDNPEFVETLPKRGYRFIAPVTDEGAIEEPDWPASYETDKQESAEKIELETARSERKGAPGKRSLWGLAIVAVLAVIAAIGIREYFRSARNGANALSLNNASVAVLPFADMSPTKDQEYFSDGLAEQLIHDLAKVSGLKVVGRSSAFQFKGKNEDLRDVGRTLGVANILEGSVRRNGNHVRITAELIKADDGFQLWSQTYDREIDDIFVVQDEIARASTEALQLKLLGGNGRRIASTLPSANPEAYQAYLQGKYFLGRGTGKEDLDKALYYTQQAIKLDENYAPAWALRASVQNMMAQFALTEVSEGFRRASNDAERAIALDPTLASAYLALAKTQILYGWDWGAANICLKKATALEPGDEEVFRIHSQLSGVFGNLEEAIKFEQQAVALDPLRANSHLSLGYLLYRAGRYDDARAEFQKGLDLNPQAAITHLSLGKVLIAEGKPQQALVEIEKEPSEWGKLMGRALAYHVLRHEQDSNSALAALIAKYGTDSAYHVAQAYAFRGESDKAFEWLEIAHKQRDGGLTEIKIDPLLKTLPHDTRYFDLLNQMHLPT